MATRHFAFCRRCGGLPAMPSSGTGERTSARQHDLPARRGGQPLGGGRRRRRVRVAGRSAPLVVLRALAGDRPVPVVADDVAALEVVDAVRVGHAARPRRRWCRSSWRARPSPASPRGRSDPRTASPCCSARAGASAPTTAPPPKNRPGGGGASARRAPGLPAFGDAGGTATPIPSSTSRPSVARSSADSGGVGQGSQPVVCHAYSVTTTLRPIFSTVASNSSAKNAGKLLRTPSATSRFVGMKRVGVVGDLEARRRVDDVDDQVLLAARVEQAEPHGQAQLVGVEREAQRRQLHDALRVALHLLDVDLARRRTSTCRGCRAPAPRPRPAGCCTSRAAARSRGPTTPSPTGSRSRIRRRRTAPRS